MIKTINIVGQLINIFDIFYVKDLIVKEVQVIKKDPRTNLNVIRKEHKVFIKTKNDFISLDNNYYFSLDNEEKELAKFLPIEERLPFVSLNNIKTLEKRINYGELEYIKPKKVSFTKLEETSSSKKENIYDSTVNGLSSLIINLVSKPKSKVILQKDDLKTEMTYEEEMLELKKRVNELRSQTNDYPLIIDTKTKKYKNYN